MRSCLLYTLILLLSNCTSVKPTVVKESDEGTTKESLAVSHFGEKYATIDNSTGDYTIVFKKYKELSDLFASVKFFVFEEESQSIIFQDELTAGTVSWHSDFEIKAISRNLNLEDKSQDPTSIYYFDVVKKEKRDN